MDANLAMIIVGGFSLAVALVGVPVVYGVRVLAVVVGIEA